MHGAATEAESEPVHKPRNVSAVATFKRGDVAAGLAGADVVIKSTYRIAGVHHSFIEPHVSMVRPEPDGGVTIWAPTQGPFAVRDEIAKVLDAAPHEVRVISMPVGGGFGGKVMLLETLLALLARKLRRPLRLALTRQQDFLMGHPAPAAQFDIELGAKRDGTLLALRARYHYDNGATGGWHAGITGSFLGGTYRIPNFDITGYEVSTNKTPTDAYRAPGAAQAYFALESARDELAQMLRLTINQPGVQIDQLGRALVIKGSVSDQASANRVNEILGRFAALAKSQIIAAIVSGCLLTFLVACWLLARVTERPLSEIFTAMALHNQHFQPFQAGLVHVRDIVYYLAIIYVSLFAATRVLEARRWR